MNTLYILLKWADSNGGNWLDRLGFGYVDLFKLYNDAYSKGYADAQSPSPLPPPPPQYCIINCKGANP